MTKKIFIYDGFVIGYISDSDYSNFSRRYDIDTLQSAKIYIRECDSSDYENVLDLSLFEIFEKLIEDYSFDCSLLSASSDFDSYCHCVDCPFLSNPLLTNDLLSFISLACPYSHNCSYVDNLCSLLGV